MSKTMPSTPKAKFKDGEKLLCYHGPLLYEAKCVKTKVDNGNFSYFVHYQGWNKNWDEWVNDTRILKINSENQELKEKLLKDHNSSLREKKKSSKGIGPLGTPREGGKKSSGGSANTSRASTPVSERSFKIAPGSSSGKRSIGDDERSTSSREDESLARKASKRTRLSETMSEDADTWRFRIDIPEELKYVLVSDMELVTVKKTLFGLPAKATVTSILNEYARYVEKNQPDNAHAIAEVMQGIKDVFEATVGSQLLYKQEKKQYYKKIQKDSHLPSDTYGSAHLLRLMVKIGPYLNKSTVDTTSETSVTFIENIICDFLLYLESNRSRLFTSKNYTETAEAYEDDEGDEVTIKE